MLDPGLSVKSTLTFALIVINYDACAIDPKPPALWLSKQPSGYRCQYFKSMLIGRQGGAALNVGDMCMGRALVGPA